MGQGMRWMWAVAGLLAVAIGAVVIAPAFGSDTVTESRATADFGFPIPWLEQDLSSLDPNGPIQTGPLSPWEYPTSVDYGALGLNVLAAAGVLALVWGAVLLVLRRRRSPELDWSNG